MSEAISMGKLIPRIIRKHTQLSDSNVDTGIHGVGVSTVESVSGSQDKVDTHNTIASPHSSSTSFNGKALGLADGNIAVLPVGTSGQALVRGASTWAAGSGGGSNIIALSPTSATKPSVNSGEVFIRWGINYPDTEALFDTTTTESLWWKVPTITALSGVNLKFDVWWYGTLNTGNVVWRLYVADVPQNSIWDIATTTVGTVTGTVGAITSNLVKTTLTTTSQVFTSTAGTLGYIKLSRIPTDAGDTYADDAILKEILISPA